MKKQYYEWWIQTEYESDFSFNLKYHSSVFQTKLVPKVFKHLAI